jgi:hypothetical protein
MSAEFATQLRARAGLVELAAPGAIPLWTIRVQVAEAWDAIRVQVSPSTRVDEAKRAALDILMSDSNDPDAYEVKHRGVLVDERATLQDAGVKDGATLLVIGRRKRPVR